MKKANSIQEQFTASLQAITTEDRAEMNGQLLAMQFLGLIDAEMENQNMSKKELATKVGTSASFITQLFMADRKPSWTMLAKMADTLGVEFSVHTNRSLEEYLQVELLEYHRKQMLTADYFAAKGMNNKYDKVLAIENQEENNYAIAG